MSATPASATGAASPARTSPSRVLPVPLSLAAQAALRLAAAGSGPNRLSILIYHRVLPHADPLFPEEIDARRFDRQIALLRTCFNVIPLGEAVQGLRQGRLPARAACITFDDGYADNAEIALPILKRHGVSATFFVASGFLNGKRMWNDAVIDTVRRAPGPTLELEQLGWGRFSIETAGQRRQALDALIGKLKYLPMEARQEQVDALCAHTALPPAADLMMTSAQVRELHDAGMEIGGHTAHHPILARLDAASAEKEIAEGKQALEAITGAPLRLFAYPNGKPGRDYLAEHAGMAKKLGFEAAVSTAWGAARPGSDLFQLPRFTPWDVNPLRFAMRLGRNLHRHEESV